MTRPAIILAALIAVTTGADALRPALAQTAPAAGVRASTMPPPPGSQSVGSQSAVPLPKASPNRSLAQAQPRPPQNIAPPQTQRSPAPNPAARPGNIAKPGEVTAYDGRQRGLVDKVSASLSNIRVLSGDFVQVGPDGSKSQGEFYLQKPGRIRFDYNAPNPIEMIADGSSVVVRDRKLATQDLYPLSQTPLRFLLADRIDLLRDTNVVGFHADEVFVTVVVEERSMLGGTHRIMMMFGAQDFALRQWTVTDPQGYDTTVAVYNLDSTRRPDPNLFRIDYTREIK